VKRQKKRNHRLLNSCVSFSEEGQLKIAIGFRDLVSTPSSMMRPQEERTRTSRGRRMKNRERNKRDRERGRR